MSKQLKVGVVGLGLIGGSMARAYSAAGDTERLKALLREGRLAKERVDRGSEDDK